MIADPKKIVVVYDPNEKKKYKVGYLARPQIITEIKRPDPAAVLVLQSNSVVELTNEEIRILFHQESGPLMSQGLLALVVDAPAPSGEKADHGGGEVGEQPEGAQDQENLDGGSGEEAAKAKPKARK